LGLGGGSSGGLKGCRGMDVPHQSEQVVISGSKGRRPRVQSLWQPQKVWDGEVGVAVSGKARADEAAAAIRRTRSEKAMVAGE